MLFIRLFSLLIALTLSLSAHQLRENYLQVDYNNTSKLLNITLEVETRLLEDHNPFIDDSKNGIISYKELKNHQQTLFDYVCRHTIFSSYKKKLSLKGAQITFHRYQDQTYMQINKSFKNVTLDGLKLDYDMFFEMEENHKLLIHLSLNRGDFILSKNLQTYTFSPTHISQLKRVSIFTQEGFIHILDGLDHLLFILMILIPTFALKGSYFSLFKLITTFALAHSLTLFISGFGLYTPNIAFVESSIALSILIVAILNYFKLYTHVNYKIVFLFGLMHGFGFANVLTIAQVSDTTSFLVALFGFNLGVEFGQIFIILLYLIPLYLMREYRYKAEVIKLICSLSALLALVWFLQRVDWI